jgi:general secretion pathway protein A
MVQTLYNRLNENKKRKRVMLLIIDEAQLLPEALLKVVNILLNFHEKYRFPIMILLMGQNELRSTIRNNELLQKSIAIRCSIVPLNFFETAKYIIFRQKKAGAKKNVFSKEAVKAIFDHSNGKPRVINHLCDLSLFIGASRRLKMINSGLINEIINDKTIL